MSFAFATRAKFNEAIELVNAGATVSAEAICRKVLEQHPTDINMLGLLGAILIKMKRWSEAEEILNQTIRLAPTFAKPYEDLGTILVEQNRMAEAIEILQEAVRLDPELESAHFNLGKALAATGKGKEADIAFERSFELSPQRKALAYAARHHQEGRLQEAEHLYRQLLRDDPNNVDALRLLGVLAASSGRPEEAENLLRKSIRIAPDFTGAMLDLGQLLKEQDRYEEAIACFRQAIEIEPGNAKPHYLLGATLAPAALTFEAIEAYRRTLEIRPKHTGALLGLGHTLKTVGRQDEAIKAYRQCMALRPDNGEIHWSLANLKTYQFSDDDIRDMENRITNEKLDELSKINFLFALAKSCEDRSEYDQAWHYYREGNSIRRMQEQYDPVHTEIQNDAIINVFTREFLHRHSNQGCTDNSPIFIVGLPRSGSTLIEQVLASHSQVEGTSELPYLGRVALSLNRNRADGVNYPEAVRELKSEHFTMLGEQYLKYCAMHRTEGAPYFIDKMPNNFPTIGLLHLILPQAKIIDARRHPLDACLGCYRQLFARGQSFTYDLTDIGEYYLQYQRMMDHWHKVLPGRVITMQYEEVVTDFENQIRRLLDYCELPWEDNVLKYYETDRPVRTASSEQVRQPIYTKSINHSEKYAAYLDELREVLEPVLPRYEHLLKLTV